MGEVPQKAESAPWREGPCLPGGGERRKKIWLPDWLKPSNRVNPASNLWTIPRAGGHVGCTINVPSAKSRLFKLLIHLPKERKKGRGGIFRINET